MKPGCMRACMHRPAVLPRGRQPAARLPWLCLEGTNCRGIPWVEGVGVNCLLVGSRGLHPVHRNCSTSKLVQDSAREGAVRMIDREAMVLRAGQRPGRRRRRCSVARRLAEELSSRTICSAWCNEQSTGTNQLRRVLSVLFRSGRGCKAEFRFEVKEFNALDTAKIGGDRPPRAWKPLVSCRSRCPARFATSADWSMVQAAATQLGDVPKNANKTQPENLVLTGPQSANH